MTGDGTESVRAWLEAHFGGVVTEIRRQPRWRPVWFATVESTGEERRVVVRGDRTGMSLIFPLDHEMRFQQLLGDRGIPTPQVLGWIDDIPAYVMDEVPGRNDFVESTEAERRSVVDDYLQVLARMHQFDVTPFAAAGIARASVPERSGTLGIDVYERNWRAMKGHPDPFIEFCLGWLRRNPPDSKGREAPVVWDSGQFHHQDGRLVAVLDLELGHIGDPMMDLAAWRSRDTVIGYGNFAELYARYEELRGEAVDLDAIKRHHFMLTLTNQLSVGPSTFAPTAETDLMTNLQWCCETNLFATEALGQILDVELPTVEPPEPRRTRATVVAGHLVDLLRSIEVDDEFLRYRLRTMFRVSRHVARADEIGDAVSEDDLDDVERVTGHRPDTWLDAQAELERFVLADAATGRHDVALLELFHKRNLRAQMLLGPAGSAMTRHTPVQPFAT